MAISRMIKGAASRKDERDPLREDEAKEGVGTRRRRRSHEALRLFIRNRLALIGLVFLLLLTILTISAGYIVRHDPVEISLTETLQPPSRSHLMGTDSFGRDILSRVLYGARVSLLIGIIAVAGAMLVGVPVGLIAGFLEGKLGNVLMRCMDAILSFPPLLLAVVVMGSLGAGIENVIIRLALVYTLLFARLVRSVILSAKEEEYVLAARSVGATNRRIVALHLFPSVLSPLLVQATATFSFAIIAEATLSFLGLGVQPPTASWGQDINEARRYIQEAWWTVVAPAIVIAFSVLSVNFVGDGLSDAVDPQLRTTE